MSTPRKRFFYVSLGDFLATNHAVFATRRESGEAGSIGGLPALARARALPSAACVGTARHKSYLDPHMLRNRCPSWSKATIAGVVYVRPFWTFFLVAGRGQAAVRCDLGTNDRAPSRSRGRRRQRRARGGAPGSLSAGVGVGVRALVAARSPATHCARARAGTGRPRDPRRGALALPGPGVAAWRLRHVRGGEPLCAAVSCGRPSAALRRGRGTLPTLRRPGPGSRRSRSAVAPLERLKILMQVQGNDKVYR